MLLVRNFIKIFFKIFLLFWLISFERVIGLPWLFLMFSLSLLKGNYLIKNWWLVLVQVVLLASVYNISFSFAIILILGTYSLWVKLSNFRLSKGLWLMILSIFAGIVLGIRIQLDWQWWMILSTFMSLFIFTIIDRFLLNKTLIYKL